MRFRAARELGRALRIGRRRTTNLDSHESCYSSWRCQDSAPAFPHAFAHVAEPLGRHVEDRRLGRGRVAELASGPTARTPVVVAKKTRFESRIATPRSRSSCLSVPNIRSIEQPDFSRCSSAATIEETPLPQLARRRGWARRARPSSSRKASTWRSSGVAFLRVEGGGDAEDPDVGVVAELIDVHAHGAQSNKLAR